MGGMGGMGGGFFNVAPQKVGKIKLNTVCLEHGKKDPNPRVAYEIKPLESFTDDPRVYELCSMLGRGEIDQRSAQVAAWHLQNGLSWPELAGKHIKHLNGVYEPYFTRAQIVRGMRIVSEAKHRAETRSKKSPGGRENRTVSPGEKLSRN